MIDFWKKDLAPSTSTASQLLNSSKQFLKNFHMFIYLNLRLFAFAKCLGSGQQYKHVHDVSWLM